MPYPSLPVEENPKKATNDAMVFALNLYECLFKKGRTANQISRIAAHPFPIYLQQILLLVGKKDLFSNIKFVKPQENFIKIINHKDLPRLYAVIHMAENVRIFDYSLPGQQFLDIILEHQNLSDLLSALQVAERIGLFDQASFLLLPPNYLPRAHFGLIVQHPYVSTLYQSMLMDESINGFKEKDLKEKSERLFAISKHVNSVATTEQNEPFIDPSYLNQEGQTAEVYTA